MPVIAEEIRADADHLARGASFLKAATQAIRAARPVAAEAVRQVLDRVDAVRARLSGPRL